MTSKDLCLNNSLILIATWVKHSLLTLSPSYRYNIRLSVSLKSYDDDSSRQCTEEYNSLLQPSPKSTQNRAYTSPSSFPSDSNKVDHAISLSCKATGSVMLCQVEIWSSPCTRIESKIMLAFQVLAVQNVTHVVKALAFILHNKIFTTSLWLRKRFWDLSIHTYICMYSYILLYMHICVYMHIYTYVHTWSTYIKRYTMRVDFCGAKLCRMSGNLGAYSKNYWVGTEFHWIIQKSYFMKREEAKEPLNKLGFKWNTVNS